MTTTTSSTVWRVREGQVEQLYIDPVRLGLPVATTEDLRGGEPAVNARIARQLFDGERGPVHDAVVLNAAAALAAYHGLGDSLEADLAAGISLARHALESGAAATVLARWVEVSQAALAAQPS